MTTTVVDFDFPQGWSCWLELQQTVDGTYAGKGGQGRTARGNLQRCVLTISQQPSCDSARERICSAICSRIDRLAIAPSSLAACAIRPKETGHSLGTASLSRRGAARSPSRRPANPPPRRPVGRARHRAARLGHADHTRHHARGQRPDVRLPAHAGLPQRQHHQRGQLLMPVGVPTQQALAADATAWALFSAARLPVRYCR